MMKGSANSLVNSLSNLLNSHDTIDCRSCEIGCLNSLSNSLSNSFNSYDSIDCPSYEIGCLLHPGAGTIKLEITSSLIASLSLGGGGQTRLSMMSSVAFFMVVVQSGGSVMIDWSHV